MIIIIIDIVIITIFLIIILIITLIIILIIIIIIVIITSRVGPNFSNAPRFQISIFLNMTFFWWLMFGRIAGVWQDYWRFAGLLTLGRIMIVMAGLLTFGRIISVWPENQRCWPDY